LSNANIDLTFAFVSCALSLYYLQAINNASEMDISNTDIIDIMSKLKAGALSVDDAIYTALSFRKKPKQRNGGKSSGAGAGAGGARRVPRKLNRRETGKGKGVKTGASAAGSGGAPPIPKTPRPSMVPNPAAAARPLPSPPTDGVDIGNVHDGGDTLGVDGGGGDLEGDCGTYDHIAGVDAAGSSGERSNQTISVFSIDSENGL
jgi:hypothetical protein